VEEGNDFPNEETRPIEQKGRLGRTGRRGSYAKGPRRKSEMFQNGRVVRGKGGAGPGRLKKYEGSEEDRGNTSFREEIGPKSRQPY